MPPDRSVPRDRPPNRPDLLFVADLVTGQPLAERRADEIALLVGDGRSVALLPAVWPPAAELVPVARELVARGALALVLPGEPAIARLAVVDSAVCSADVLARVVADRTVDPAPWPLLAPSVPARPRIPGSPRVVGVVLPTDAARRLRLVRALRALPDALVPAALDRRAPRGWLRLRAGTTAERVAGVDALVVPAGSAGDRLREVAAASGRPVLDDAAVLRGADLSALSADAVTQGDGSTALRTLVARLLADDAEAPPAEATGSAALTAHATAAARVTPAGATVLYVSSNGAGMGHLTRLMAMARRAGPGVRPLFLSMSQAVPVVAAEGFPYEYVPSRGDLGIGPRRWNVSFAARFAEMLRRERPAAVVFDGTFPYDGLFVATEALPGVRLVWSRRGMWRPQLGASALSRSARFDLVVEPGELAASADRGATADRSDAVRVGPVTMLDAAEQLPREQAAAVLGIDASRPAALVTLGAGNINDITSDLGIIVGGLLDVPGLQVVVTRPVIADAGGEAQERVHGVSVYPISRYLTAIDLAVAAAGYNSFHELVGFGVPTAFLPNTSTALDDQPGRARWAQEAGVGLCIDAVTPAEVERIAVELGDPARRAGFAQRCRDAARPNGAGDAQRAVERLLGLASAERTGGAA